MNQKQLKNLLHYEPETGVFSWRVTIAPRAQAGTIAGTMQSKGYRQIMVCGEVYYAHRLVFLYMEGELPPDQVDHINRERDDNRWCNLRHATDRINHENKCTNNSFIGVHWNSVIRRWVANKPRIKGKMGLIGRFKTHLAACYARHAWECQSD